MERTLERIRGESQSARNRRRCRAFSIADFSTKRKHGLARSRYGFSAACDGFELTYFVSFTRFR
jgi:hypothetical protein